MSGRSVIAALVTLCVVWSAQVAALAQESPTPIPVSASFTIQPAGADEGSAYFTVTANPNERKELSISLANTSDVKGEARTYAADAFTMVNGGMGVEGSSDEPISGSTKWLDYETSTLDLEGKTAEVRSFSITIPKSAKPGEYLTSLVIENAEPIKGTGSIALNQVMRVALPILIVVPGPLTPKLEIGTASYKDLGTASDVDVSVQNTGNERLSLAGKITIVDPDGTKVFNQSLNLGPIYAGDKTAIRVGLATTLPEGTYTVALTLTDSKRALSVADNAIELIVAPSTEATVNPINGISITSFTLNELRDPTSDQLQAVEGVVVIDNTGDPLYNARLTLHVTRDGEKVEDLVLGSSLSFPGGQSEFRQRYLPVAGWDTGIYEFSVTLEQVDPTTGLVTQVATAKAQSTVQGS